MFLPCRPCCGIAGCVYTDDPPDSVYVDISFLKSDTSTTGISGINLSTGTTARSAYSTIILGKQNADDATPTDYASAACYAFLDNLEGSYSLIKSTVSGGFDYTYTDSTGFELLLELRSYSSGTSTMKFRVNGCPSLRMLQAYSATPPTEVAMSGSSWNSGASLCFSPALTVDPGITKWYRASGSNEYRKRGPTFDLPYYNTCDDTSGDLPAFHVDQSCEIATGPTSMSVYSSAYAGWQSASNISAVDGPDSQNGGLTSPIEFDVVAYVSWPDYATSLSNHQATYFGVRYPYFQTVGSNVRIYFLNGAYYPLLTTPAPITAVASRYSIDSIVGLYGVSEVPLFKRT